MKLVKVALVLSCEHEENGTGRIIPRMLQREGWACEGSGLACTPCDSEDEWHVPTLQEATSWIFTHVSSGKQVGAPFPASKEFAHLFLEEIAHEGLDYTLDMHSIRAKSALYRTGLQNARKRADARWEIVQTEQLTLW